MSPAPPGRRIDWTGWSTVALGALCIVLAAVQAIAPMLLETLAGSLGPGDDPTRALREAWAAGAAISASLNAAFGIVLVVVGLGVAARARWAHPALEIAGWASIAVLAVLAKPSLAPFAVMAGGGRSARIAMIAIAAGLMLGQVGAILWFLRYWRRPEIKAEFGR